jgi:hypothetical protein
MKLKIMLPAICIATLLAIGACNKNSNPVTQTIEKTFNVGATETFTLTLPESEFPYEIVSQATHAKLSTIAPDANGNLVYTYQYLSSNETPLSDDVIIANVNEKCRRGPRHPGDSLPPPPPPHRHDSMPPPPPPPPHHKKGGCNHDQDTLRTIRLHFNIK